MTLTFCSSRTLAEAYHADMKGKGTLEQLTQSVLKIFPTAMGEYAQPGRLIYRARLEAGALETKTTQSGKIGRNDPCPCGSGKKFKKCCGRTGGSSSSPVFH